MTYTVRNMSLIALTAFLSGCALPASDYSGQPGAKQALAKCRAQADTRPSPTANPFGTVADQNQYIVDCMRAAGYKIQ
jgi:hypothetical protein